MEHDIHGLVQAIHKNSVAHGWWETPRSFAEIVALIHSEWSEALEEYRACRPMLWYSFEGDCLTCDMRPEIGLCAGDPHRVCHAGCKPEGIAVELIDGVIRILDYFGAMADNDVDVIEPMLRDRFRGDYEEDLKLIIKKVTELPTPEYIANLHYLTSEALPEPLGERIVSLATLIGIVFSFIRAKGYDPESLLRTKHAYNLTRPYKHGNKLC